MGASYAPGPEAPPPDLDRVKVSYLAYSDGSIHFSITEGVTAVFTIQCNLCNYVSMWIIYFAIDNACSYSVSIVLSFILLRKQLPTTSTYYSGAELFLNGRHQSFI